jgi:hypothetical protein
MDTTRKSSARTGVLGPIVRLVFFGVATVVLWVTANALMAAAP